MPTLTEAAVPDEDEEKKAAVFAGITLSTGRPELLLALLLLSEEDIDVEFADLLLLLCDKAFFIDYTF